MRTVTVEVPEGHMVKIVKEESMQKSVQDNVQDNGNSGGVLWENINRHLQ